MIGQLSSEKHQIKILTPKFIRWPMMDQNSHLLNSSSCSNFVHVVKVIKDAGEQSEVSCGSQILMGD